MKSFFITLALITISAASSTLWAADSTLAAMSDQRVISDEDTQGKIQATQALEMERMKNEMLTRIATLECIQRDADTNPNSYVKGYVSALGQTLTLMEHFAEAAVKANNYDVYVSGHKEVEKLFQSALALSAPPPPPLF